MTGYFEQADPSGISFEYPSEALFVSTVATIPRDALRAIQEKRFAQVMERAWKVPFYSRRWLAAGLEPGDIRGLDDLHKIPAFSKADLMESIAAFPPWGDYHGIEDWSDPFRHSVVVHTTSGTTGDPQPLYFGARDREVQNLLLARAYLLQGLGVEDVVHSVYGFGPVNGGHYIREALLHFTKATLIPAGTGNDTRSEQQIRLMQRFGATALVGFADYLLRLAEVAAGMGLQPGRDLPVRMISGHIPHDQRDALSAAWGGAEVFDWYGVGDTGILAAEGPDRDGLYLWEDAHVVEVIDPETGAPVPDGEPGSLVVTCLFKDGVYPIVRFDTKDVSRKLGPGGGLGFTLDRIEGFLGRADNMVKLRGVNVYPTAIGGLLAGVEGLGGEYVCRLRDDGGRQDLLVEAELAPGIEPSPSLVEHVEAHLRERLGVAVLVDLVAPGATAEATGVEARQKPIRLIDER